MTVKHYKYNQHTDKWDYIKTVTEKADYGTVYIPKYDTPAGYYNHHRDWDKGWTVTGNGTFNVYYYPKSYSLNVNTILNNVENGNGYSEILFNVYINDKIAASKVQDYYGSRLYGDTYKIEMIQNSKYTYEKQAYEGTIKDNTVVKPKALSVPVVERTACVQSGNDNFYAYAFVTSPGPVSRVTFPNWTNEAGQDDINPDWCNNEKADENGDWVINGQHYNYRKYVKSADHKRKNTDEHNWYNVHVYAYNAYGGYGFASTTFSFKYPVTFNYNKPLNATSSINNSSETCRTVTYNTAYGTLPNPNMIGWTFAGWYTSATGGNKVSGTDIYKYAYATTLYAHWTARQYTLTYTSNGGNGADYYQTVKYDNYMETLENRFTRTGYSFVGYKSDKSGVWAKYNTDTSSDWGYNKGTIRFYDYTGNKWISYNLWYWHGIYNKANGRLDGNDTLKAQWRANDYTITFDYNEPKTTNQITSNSTKTKVVTYDSKYGELPKPSLTGWKFDGWYVDEAGKIPVTADTVYKTAADTTLHAHWTPNSYIITFDYNDGVTKNTTCKVTYDSSVNNTVTPPDRTGYEFDYWYADDGIHVYDKDGKWVNESTHKYWYNGRWHYTGDITVHAHWTDRKAPQNTYLQAESDGLLCGKANAVKTGTNPAANPVIAKVTAELQGADSLYEQIKNVISEADSNAIKNGWSSEWFSFKDKNGNAKPVTLTLYSRDDGSGIKSLSIYDTADARNTKTKSDFNNRYGNLSISKMHSGTATKTFYGNATDMAGNITLTNGLTIKADTKAPYSQEGFTVKTGTIQAPLGSQGVYYANQIESDINESTEKDNNGFITNVKPGGMKTEIAAKIADDESGIKYVFAFVKDTAGSIEKVYPCRKIEDTYIAVNGSDHKSDEIGKLPNLYTDFKGSTKLEVSMVAFDNAGNKGTISVDPDSSKYIINMSIYSQVIRDDHENPDTAYTGRPVFLLNQSGYVNVVTYGYVESVDIDFPAELQTAALHDVSKQQSAKKLGTVPHIQGALVENGKLTFNSEDGCTRVINYPFIVPLYSNDQDIISESTGKPFMEKNDNGTYNQVKIKTKETAYKHNTAIDSNADFVCGEAVTKSLRTHLVN